MASGKRILNVDQTPIGDSNFCQRAWMPSNARNSQITHQILPRITMMVGIDNYGEIYYSLLQANSNNTTMGLVLTYLASILTAQRKNWREDTIVLLDGASWHTSGETQETLKRLNMPASISGPYRYDGAPVSDTIHHYPNPASYHCRWSSSSPASSAGT